MAARSKDLTRLLCSTCSTAQRSTAQHSASQHSTAQHSTAQHSTAQHSTAQHSTAQHSTAQHSTAQHERRHLSTTMRPSSDSNGWYAQLLCQGLCHNRRQALQHKGKASCFLKSLQPSTNSICQHENRKCTNKKKKKKKSSMITEELTVDASSPLAKDETEGAGWGVEGGFSKYMACYTGQNVGLPALVYKLLRLQALTHAGRMTPPPTHVGATTPPPPHAGRTTPPPPHAGVITPCRGHHPTCVLYGGQQPIPDPCKQHHPTLRAYSTPTLWGRHPTSSPCREHTSCKASTRF